MPIQVPNLDDRNYDQLVRETDVLIARYFPEYADIGPTDPAVAINELFCYLFDFTMYQLNRITPEARSNFASLLGVRPVYGRPPEEALRQALAKLARIDRAVTADDIEAVLKKAHLTPGLLSRELLCGPVLRAWTRTSKSIGEPLRVFVVQRDLADPTKRRAKRWEEDVREREEDLRVLYAFLRKFSPIGTRYLLAHAPVLKICVSAEIVKRKDSTINWKSLADAIINKLGAYIHPLKGGDNGDGWPFDKAVSRGDIYNIIEGMPGVDHVRSLYIKEAGKTTYSAADTLSPPEGGLLEFMPEESDITVR